MSPHPPVPSRSEAAKQPRPTVLESAALALLLGAVLRGAWFGLMEFKHDEVEILRLTRHWLQTGIPRHGIMSGVGIRNPPGFVDLLLPVAAVTDSPLWAGAWIALLNLIGLVLLAAAGTLVAGPRAGAFALCLAGAHPWLVLYSRKVWAQSTLPLLVAALLLVMATCARRQRSRLVALVPLIVCIAWQVHYSAYALVAVAGLWLGSEAWSRRLHWPMASLGCLLGLLCLSPYLIDQAGQGFEDLRRSLALEASERSGPAAIFGTWWRMAFAGGLGSPFAWSPTGRAPLTSAVPGGGVLEPLALVATAVVILLSVGAGLQGPERGSRSLSLAWPAALVLLPPLLYLAKGIAAPPHYFVVSLPAWMLLAGAGLERLARATRLGAGLAWGLAAIGATLVLSILGALRAAGGSGGDYGVAYAVQSRAADLLVAHRVHPLAIDARASRDGSVGVLYLITLRCEPEHVDPTLGARIVDHLLTPSGPPLPGPVIASERVGPLEVSVFRVPGMGAGARE